MRRGPIPICIAVVDADIAICDEFARRLGDDIVKCQTVDELLGLADGTCGVVAVLGPSFASERQIDMLEHSLRTRTDLGAVLITTELSTSLLQHALRAGVRDVLAAPLEAGQLPEAIQRVARDLVLPAPISAPGSLPPAPTGPVAEGDRGHVLTVFSTKGGSGKSVIAANLAVSLAMSSDKPVCLVDADLQFGDIAVMLKLAPQYTVVEAVNSMERLDAQYLRDLLSTHPPSGLWVLPAPLEPAFADQIGAQDMVRVVELLTEFCGHVVVDTPAYFNEVVLGLIEASDDVLLVAGMDIPNIKNVKIGLQTLRLLNTPMEKLRLVLNRANSKVKLEVSEVERTLHVNADALIPSDVVVPQSVNKGIPVVLDAPRSGPAKAINQLAGLFAEAESRRR